MGEAWPDVQPVDAQEKQATARLTSPAGQARRELTLAPDPPPTRRCEAMAARTRTRAAPRQRCDPTQMFLEDDAGGSTESHTDEICPFGMIQDKTTPKKTKPKGRMCYSDSKASKSNEAWSPNIRMLDNDDDDDAADADDAGMGRSAGRIRGTKSTLRSGFQASENREAENRAPRTEPPQARRSVDHRHASRDSGMESGGDCYNRGRESSSSRHSDRGRGGQQRGPDRRDYGRDHEADRGQSRGSRERSRSRSQSPLRHRGSRERSRSRSPLRRTTRERSRSPVGTPRRNRDRGESKPAGTERHLSRGAPTRSAVSESDDDSDAEDEGRVSPAETLDSSRSSEDGISPEKEPAPVRARMAARLATRRESASSGGSKSFPTSRFQSEGAGSDTDSGRGSPPSISYGQFGLMSKEKFYADSQSIDTRSLAYRQVPVGEMFLTQITRHRSASSKWPTFVMKIQDGSGRDVRELLLARRQRHGKNVSYLMGVNKDAFCSGMHSGKLKSNFKGTEFVLYDDGSKQDRAEVAKVIYTNKSYSNPRGLVVRVPGPSKKDLVMVNALPEWDPVSKVHSLKFNGRATEVSVKNFKLIKDYMQDDSKQDQQPFMLRMGKVGKDTFNLDFRFPLNPIQALGIALTSFEGGRT